MSDRRPELFRGLIERADRTVLTTHMNPDGDAIGSEMAMARFLRAAGLGVSIVNTDPTPENFRFLEDETVGAEVYDPAVHDPLLRSVGLVMLLDNSAPDRLGRMEPVVRSLSSKVLCVDHHATQGTPWAHNLIDESACATSVIVFDLMTASGHRPDVRTAEAIYAGLSTDTGFFRFGSTTPEAHLIAAELLRIGVEPARTYREVFERNSPAYTRLLGQALAGLRLEGDGAIVSVRITRAMEASCDAAGVDTSEMATSLLAIDGIRVALLFRELAGGRVKVSLRSKGALDVYHLAVEFGGGGHRNASGIVREGPLDEVAEAVVRRAREMLTGGTASPA